MCRARKTELLLRVVAVVVIALAVDAFRRRLWVVTSSASALLLLQSRRRLLSYIFEDPFLSCRGINLFDDSAEDILGGSRLGNKFRGLSKIQILRSSSSDKERANNVAKIKVVICFVLHVSLLCFL
ncbi:hypothetical protein Ahy_B03g062866 [Arachis hypogaea]|uniref:Uncharacterized protein n=1 Tax=Arachis hypogaea TaxID=3818 RepID=A0A444ZW07_ARAHY|nr:hypothetical protein Ahy_B03g062866 [Arachis hypogaea]